MPRQHSLILISSFMLAGVMAIAQTNIAYSNTSLQFRSDLPAKSVLVSSLTPEKAGDESPIIGYANWADGGNNFQCHSYLRFSNLFLPRYVLEDLSLITKAELVLYPVSVQNSPEEKDKISRFTVRRVLENWADTATRWNHQPVADSVYEVKWVLRKKQKTRQVSVDVTGLVMDMIRYENYGFMISYDSAGKTPVSKWQWFASPWYEDVDRRPLLVIYYKQPFTPLYSTGNVPTDQEIRRTADMKPTQNTGPVAQPVITTTPPAGTKEQ